MRGKVRIVTASAGSGKTYKLTQVLEDAIASGRAQPERIVATTFTNQAAAELVERARRRLLKGGRAAEAHRLMAARIGTVNSVCGSIVADFAFELGMSPSLRVLDENGAEVEVNRALARVVSVGLADELQEYSHLFERDLEWRHQVRLIIEAARANRLSPDDLRRSSARSVAELDRCLGPCETTSDLDAELAAAIEAASAGIARGEDETKGTAEYVELLRECAGDLRRGALRWGAWAKLTSSKPTKRSLPDAALVQAAAARHIAHPRLRADMHRLIELLFGVAADGLEAYEGHKRERGVIDFIDQEALALTLLKRPDVRAELAGQFDLVLVDEFQDTSPIQLEVFLALQQIATESVWVGDPKQAIFGFRGTDPALMDAAIKSLTSARTDPDLVEEAARAVAGPVESLKTSYRSRPELVALTSDIFAPAFARQGMAEENTRLVASLARDPADLGVVVEHWPLDLAQGAKNAGKRAEAVAAGVKRMLGERPLVRDRHTGAVRPLEPADVAVLCRTNVQCQSIAEALGALGVPAIVPRMGLLQTAEGRLLLAGLRLWLDPRDAVAAAEISRMVTHAADLAPLIATAFANPGWSAFASDPTVKRLIDARALTPDLGPLAAVDAVVEALELRALCAAWGGSDQRAANLDGFRAHAVAHASEAEAAGRAVTLPGLLRYLDELVDVFGWDASPADRQALLAAAAAVTVSTWHRAKGLEWQVTVLYGLEALRGPRAYGLHVMSDRERFDVDDPLGQRWLRFWPNPYTTSNQLGPVKAAFEASDAYAELVARGDREALRVLYVGWTRARDRLVLAAERGKLLGGLLGKLVAIDPTLIVEPDPRAVGPTSVTWAGRSLTIDVRPCSPSAPIETAPSPGSVIEGRPFVVLPPARMSPSMAVEVACELGQVVTLGPRLALRGRPPMNLVGDAVHGFLAADRPGLPHDARRDLAEGLLTRFGVADHLSPDDLIASSACFWTWVAASFPDGRVHREWPVAHRLDSGTLVSGTADLVVRSTAGSTIVDHKTFPGVETMALERARGYAGQLGTYARAVATATGQPVHSTWIHFPVIGQVVEVRVLPA